MSVSDQTCYLIRIKQNMIDTCVVGTVIVIYIQYMEIKLTKEAARIRRNV